MSKLPKLPKLSKVAATPIRKARAAVADIGAALRGPSKTERVADAVILWTLLALAAAMPLFFLPWTSEVLELNKQFLLFVAAGVSGIAWVAKMFAANRFEYRHTPMNWLVGAYVAAVAASAWVSQSRYASLVGDSGQEAVSAMTLFALAVLYAVIVNNVRTAEALRNIAGAAVLGGGVTAAFALLQGLGVHALPFAFAATPAFTTAGTATATAMYLAFIVTLIGGGLLMGYHRADDARSAVRGAWLNVGTFARAGMLATAVLSLAVIAAVDAPAVNLALLVASATLVAFAFRHARSLQSINGVLLPIAASVLSLLLLLANHPVGLGYPAEVSPSMRTSADIATTTLREYPVLGSGPGTFGIEYAKHRPADMNADPNFWNVRFDRSASAVLTSLATVGGLGMALWLLAVGYLALAALRALFRAEEGAGRVMVAIFASWLLLVVGKFFYGTTMTLEVAFWVATAILAAVLRDEWRTVRFDASPRAALGFSFPIILVAVLAVGGTFLQVRRYASEVRFAQAVANDRAQGDVDATLGHLLAAAQLNPNNDAMVRNAALTLFISSNQLLATEAQPQPHDGESDEDFRARAEAEADERVDMAVARAEAAVQYAVLATEVAPANAMNWAVLATITQHLMGIMPDADRIALAALQRAAELEPTSPVHQVELGKVYMWQADRYAEVVAGATDADDAEQVATVREAHADAEQRAMEAFARAAELKPDYAAAHYHMAVAHERQGNSEQSIASLEAAAVLAPQDLGVGLELAALYEMHGRIGDAAAVLEYIRDQQPNIEGINEKIADLRARLTAPDAPAGE